MTDRFIDRFETGLGKLAAGLQSVCGEKRRDKILLRIGRLQEKCHGINESWASLRRIFAGQIRVTATFKQRDGRKPCMSARQPWPNRS